MCLCIYIYHWLYFRKKAKKWEIDYSLVYRRGRIQLFLLFIWLYLCFFFFCVVVLCFFGEMSIDVLSEKANCYIRTAIISWQLIVVYVVHNVNIEMHYFFWEGVLHIFNITWQKDKSSHLLASLLEMILSIPIS